MYLDILENNGKGVKELASQFLAKKYKQPSTIVWCKLMNEKRDVDGIFSYKYVEPNKNNLLINQFSFGDFGYTDATVESGDIDLSKQASVEWMGLVHSALNEISIDLSSDYLKNAQKYIDKICSTYKKTTREKAKDVYDETILNCAEKVQKLRDDFFNLCDPSNENILVE